MFMDCLAIFVFPFSANEVGCSANMLPLSGWVQFDTLLLAQTINDCANDRWDVFNFVNFIGVPGAGQPIHSGRMKSYRATLIRLPRARHGRRRLSNGFRSCRPFRLADDSGAGSARKVSELQTRRYRGSRRRTVASLRFAFLISAFSISVFSIFPRRQ